ncbi:YdcF family protein [Geothrix sp. PMB-07]|uniref:YdcF family protein n=1 Tax=Geothrix sp. PMB-07 TaxID=3068640 RepID=UPI0027407BD3|nr:YdcF family protein [Geothrix sp. PMB-07]WLT30720.1 YdcF family protein [Geothrix sp. PMB-07]
MSKPFHAPPHASFLQKLGPGGAASLGLALLSCFGLVGLPWAYRLAQVLRGASGDEAAPADAILVLGRRLEADQPTRVFLARLAHAERLWRSGLAPRIFVAGGATGASVRSEAEAGRDWLVARGVPLEAILLEGRSQHTLENLFNVRAEMRDAGWSTLLMVSDSLHLARAQATAQGLGLAVRCSPALEAPPARGSAGWWRRAASEAFLLHWYHTGMLYSRLIRSQRQLERVT